MTGTCATCGGPIEYVAETKDPFWSHTNLDDLTYPHAARPTQDMP